MTTTVSERFWAKVDKGDGTGCWLWTAARKWDGYGQFRLDGKIVRAHRLAYDMLVAPVAGLELDHLCRVRHCVRPDHLEPVSKRVNTLRGVGPTSANAVKEACVNGHPFDDANTYAAAGRRGCRACNREAARRYASRKRVPA